MIIDGKELNLICKGGEHIPIQSMKEFSMALSIDGVQKTKLEEKLAALEEEMGAEKREKREENMPQFGNESSKREGRRDGEKVSNVPAEEVEEPEGANSEDEEDLGIPENKKGKYTVHDFQLGSLEENEKDKLFNVIDQHSSCFSWDGSLGTCDLIEHRIELTSDKPVRRSGYRTSQHGREVIEKEVREMLEKGIIEPSVSAYAAGVVLVPKKNGETRFCVDYRGLNKITKEDNYPLPLTRSEIFDTLGEAKIFSCLDCQQGYWQVKVAEEDRHKTAFRCHLGLWQWRVMSFGLRNAPATYQRLMSHVLSGYIGKFCHVFIDDIICFSKTFEEHLEHLHLIFERLEKAGLKLKPPKCSFAKTEVKYLGHVIAPGEIRPDPSNIAKIRDLEPPTTVKGVRELVGMASYYRSFVPDFSRRASPLTELTKKNVHFQWEEEQQRAFDDLKTALTSEPVLALPDFTKPFILMTDGSKTGLGAVLSQDHGDTKERVVAYASKKTGPLERNYSACELECLALVWAVKYFREYLLGRTAIVVTDNWALKWLMSLENAAPRLQRWRMTLLEYDLEIVHKPGKQHRNADFLSRMHQHFPEDGEREEEEGEEGPSGGSQHPMEVRRAMCLTSSKKQGAENERPGNDQLEAETNVENESRQNAGRALQDWVDQEIGNQENKNVKAEENQTLQDGGKSSTPRSTGAAENANTSREKPKEMEKISKPIMGRKALREAQERDEDCQHLFKHLKVPETPVKHWHRDHSFRLAQDGVLEEIACDLTGEEVYKVVLPKPLIRQAVQDAHVGHLKTKKTLEKLRGTYFFKHMYAVCHRYVQSCSVCQTKDRGPKYQAPLGSMPEPLGAWHTVAVDVLGPLPQTRNGKKYIVVITDYLTKYVLAVPTRDQTAETIAAVLMDKFLEYGLPEKLITDNGTNFRSKLVEELCRLMKISRLFTTPYHPQFDGLCERYNRTLAAMLRAFVAENQRDWDLYLPYVMHAYRAAPQESTKESPFFLMFFRPCRAPLDMMLSDTQRRNLSSEEMDNFKSEAVRKLQEAFRVVKARLTQAHQKQKTAHDRKSKPREFQIGDEVYLLDERVEEGNSRKLHRPWKPGYRIIRRTGPLNYLVEHPSRRGRLLRVHVERLKASIPEMLWPDEYGQDENETRKGESKTALDVWLEREKNRYKPFSSDLTWNWESSEEESETEVATLLIPRVLSGEASASVQTDGVRGEMVGAEENQAVFGESGEHIARNISPVPREGEQGPRRSKRLEEKRAAEERKQKHNQ